MNATLKTLPLILVVFFVCIITSCAASFGTPFNASMIDQLKPGMSEEKVVELLGAKSRSRSAWGDGYALSWSYGKSGLFGIGKEVNTVTIEFNSNKKMKEIISQHSR